MLEGNNPGETGERKGTLVARVDERVVPALDRIASTNQVNTGQLMSQYLGDIADTVEFLGASQGGTFDTIEDRFAKLIIERCHGATPEALRAVGNIWYRAADILSTRNGG